MSLVTLNPSLTLSYSLSGLEDGPWLVCAHSLASNGRMWDAQMAFLESRFQVLNIDLPGHGASSTPPGPWTIEMMGGWVLDVLAQLGVDKCHWLGLSLGGMVGQAAALAAPQRIASLVLADSTSAHPPASRPMWEARAATAAEKGMVGIADGTLDRWFTTDFARVQPSALADMREAILATPVEGFVQSALAIPTMNFTPRLGEIKCPTLVVVGDQDHATPLEHSQALAQGIQGARLVVIKNAAHLSAVEQPGAFNSALDTFYEPLISPVRNASK